MNTSTTIKQRTSNEIAKMGYSIKDANVLVEKFWLQVEYLKTAREKALYITA